MSGPHSFLPNTARWIPGYMAITNRSLVTNPRELDPEPGFTSETHGKLWRKVWSRTLVNGVEVNGWAGGALTFDMKFPNAAREGVENERPEAVARYQRAITLMNVFEYSLCLASSEADSTYSEYIAITASNLVCLRASSHALQLGRTGAGHYGAALLAIDSSDPIITALERMVPEDILERASEITDSIISSPNIDPVELAALIHRGCSAHQDSFFEQAVIINWAVMEALQTHIWREHVEADFRNRGAQLTNRIRKNMIEDKKAADITDELATRNLLDAQFKVRMDTIRKARNAWAHSGEMPTEETSMDSVHAAAELYYKVEQLTLPSPQIHTHGAKMPI